MTARAYEHPVDASTVLPVLRPFLPYSLPLYRRLQFPFRTPSSHVLATLPPPGKTGKDAAKEPPHCFAIAFLDRSRRPETELWIFLSSEVPGRCISPSHASPSHARPSCPLCKDAVLALIRHIATLPSPIPTSPRLVPASENTPKANSTTTSARDEDPLHHRDSTHPVSSYIAHLAQPSILLLGAAHALVARILLDAGLVRTELPGVDVPYVKYLFRVADLPPPRELPCVGRGRLRWGEVGRRDCGVVRARSAIPRSEETLVGLPSVALFASEEKGEDAGGDSGERAEDGDGVVERGERIVAWAFLGLDGSLTSLHVEEGFRGQGLAKVVAGKLFREKRKVFGEVGPEEEGWAHADVAVENWESRGVARSLGGAEGWEVFWVRVDLERLAE